MQLESILQLKYMLDVLKQEVLDDITDGNATKLNETKKKLKIEFCKKCQMEKLQFIENV